MPLDEITNPRMKMTLPRLSPVELRSLINHATTKLEIADNPFCRWLATVCLDEIDRRNNPGIEATMLEIPVSLRPIELASFLEGVFLLSRSVITQPIAAFVDELEIHVICQTSTYLQTLDAAWEQVS